MQSPIRLWYAARSEDDLALLLGAWAVALLFSATPFVIPELADQFDVALGTAGLYSTVQVGGFAIAAFAAGRRLAPSNRVLRIAVGVAVAANGASALSTAVLPLLAARAAAGAAAGLITWLAWANGMHSAGAIRKVAVVGPLGALIGAPLSAWLVSRHGLQAVFWMLALLHAPIVLARSSFVGMPMVRRAASPSRSNVVLLAAVGLYVLAGSAVFVHAAAIGERVVGLDPLVVSAGFSANALAGLIAASRPASDTVTSWPALALAISVGLVAWSGIGWVWFVAIAAWGAFFWLTVPRLLRAIAAWSLVPEERVGDAQSIMAAGRALGPAFGGVVLGSGRFGALGAFSVCGVLVAAAMLEGVRRYRTDHAPPLGVVGLR